MIVGMRYCNNCKRIEFMRDGGLYFYKCEECGCLVSKLDSPYEEIMEDRAGR